MMTERQGIEIDYCPQCRGVWLDRGELDKLIAGGSSNQPATGTRTEEYRPREAQPQYRDERHHKDDYYYKKKKKESFLKDLFDF